MKKRNKIHTAAWRLFNYRYQMLIPQIFFYGEKYLEKHGYAVSGDPELDHHRLLEPHRVMQTPAALAMFHAEGCKVNIVNPKDSVHIYDDIQEHLLDWERFVQQGVHPDDVPPITDFRKFEAVAMELYRMAKHFEPQEKSGSGIRDRLTEMNRRRNPLAVEKKLRSRLMDEDGNLKPYVSIVDRIEKEMLRGYY